jgi:hypothetical protein
MLDIKLHLFYSLLRVYSVQFWARWSSKNSQRRRLRLGVSRISNYETDSKMGPGVLTNYTNLGAVRFPCRTLYFTIIRSWSISAMS